MTRVKRGVLKNKRKSKILKLAKGFRNARSTKFKQAKQALIRAGQHAFSHRRKKKREFRKLWQIQISAALKEHNISYSKFIDLLTKKEFSINRKMLAQIARESKEIFAKIVEKTIK
ncbi:MAG: 50S ribosomal protein L20 [Candidatus Pacebacteria bacterium]|nr:50S ribosomal protein L20 [Candidatus Paceibacterota bacterium]